MISKSASDSVSFIFVEGIYAAASHLPCISILAWMGMDMARKEIRWLRRFSQMGNQLMLNGRECSAVDSRSREEGARQSRHDRDGNRVNRFQA
jgi:hypothetical protein